MPTRVSSTKSVKRAPLPSRMEGLPAKNRPLRVPLHAIILAAQGMDGLLPESFELSPQPAASRRQATVDQRAAHGSTPVSS